MRRATPRTRPAADAARQSPPATPPLAWLWPPLLYAACTLALVYPALAGQFLVSPVSDQFTGTAYRIFGGTMLRETGAIPQWNPYLLGGLPFIGAQHGDIFYPTFLFRFLFPADAVLTWSFATHLVLAGLFTFGFLRAWGLGYFPSMLGGVAYMLSGQVASLVAPGHDGKMYVSALTPLMLWMILRGMRDGTVWAWGVVSLATGLAILSPHFQLTYYMGLLAGAFTLFLAFRRGEGALDRGLALRRLAAAVGAALLGFGIASVHFLPFFEYIPYSPRGGGGRGYEYATSYSMPPEELFGAYLPQFSGIIENYWGRNPLKLHSEYLGASVLLLAGAAFGNRARRGFVLFWTFAAALTLLVAFGGHTPFYRLWYHLPMMRVVRAPGMSYFIISLAAAMFAAVGTERLLASGVSRRYLLWWAGAAAAIAVLASTGALAAITTGFAEPDKVEAAVANAPHLLRGAWRSLLFVVAAAGTLWLMAAGRVSVRTAAWTLTIVCAIDLWSVVRQYFRFSPPADVLYASDPTIDYLRGLREPGRVVAYPLEPLRAQDPYLNGDALMVHQVRTTSGHQANEIQRWVQLAGAKSPAPPVHFFTPDSSRQFRSLSNTRFWLTNAELPSDFPELRLRLIRRVGPVTNAAGNTVYLYELDEDNPAAWIAPVIVKARPEEIYATVMNPRFDPRRAALFDASAEVPAATITALPEPLSLRPRITTYQPGHITVELDEPAPASSALIVSENYYPGWEAFVDGRKAPIGRAQYTLIGVALPAGGRRIELRFHDPAYDRGKTLTLVALAATIALIVGGAILERKRRG